MSSKPKFVRKLVGSEDERAVSPVIGVILMVAITVILAAVIAAFVLDIGPGQATITASADIDGDESDEVNIEIQDGSDADNVVLVAAGTGTVVTVFDDEEGEAYEAAHDIDDDFSSDEEITVPEEANTGATYTVSAGDDDGNGDSSGAFFEDDTQGAFEGGDYQVWAINGEITGGDSIDDADASSELAEFTLDEPEE